jgi:hypothetical protein
MGLKPNLFWAKGVFGKTHPYAFPFLFHPSSFWYPTKKTFLNIKKFQKNSWIFLNLFLGPLHFFFTIPLYIW